MSNETRTINGHPFIPYHKPGFAIAEMEARCSDWLEWMKRRRSVRDFSDRAVPESVIRQLIATASTAPSGANRQPWTFCAVSNPRLKKQIREAAEKEEFESYHGRMPEEWLRDLEPIGTDWQKPFLEKAPWLIIVFRRSYEREAGGHKHTNYYVTESVGIACGFFLAAVHHAGLAALTHTPSPMNFLSELLDRPDNEKPFLLIPVGYAAPECWVPDLKRKNLEEVSAWYT